MAASERKSAMIWAAAWFVGACFIYFVAIPIGIEEPSYATQSPALFPRFMAVTFGTLAVVLFVLEWRGFHTRNTERISLWFFVAPAVATIYALLLGPIGFPITTGCALAALLLLFGERQPSIILIVPGVTSIGIHTIFVYLLRIPLP